MGVSYCIELETLIFSLSGDNTRKEAEDAFRKAFSEPSLPEKPNILIDAFSSERHRPTGEVIALGEVLCSHASKMGRRCALVMNEDRPRQMELERFLSGISLRHQLEFGVFISRDCALEWLREQDGKPKEPNRREPI